MANYFMQGGDGKEYGPVSAEQLRQWATEGRANVQTQVRLAEGGPYQALGLVAELNAAAPSPTSGYTPSPAAPSSSFAHTLAQNSGQAGTDSTMQVKRLATVLASGGGWMKFLAVLMYLCGALYILSIWGILICWIPIWLGVVLWNGATKAEQAVFTGLESDLAQALDRVRFVFKLYGILFMVGFVMGALMVILFITLGVMKGLGNLGNMGIH